MSNDPMRLTPSEPAVRRYAVELLDGNFEHLRWRGPFEAHNDGEARGKAHEYVEQHGKAQVLVHAKTFRLFRQVD